MRTLRLVIALAATVTFATASPVAAATITFTDSGWYDSGGNHTPSNQNYFAGTSLRNFFVFDLSSVTGTVSSVTLRLTNPTTGYSSGDPTETYSLFDVTTPIASLVAGGSGLVATYTDLGTGVTFGSRVVSSADNGQIVAITLNSSGLAAVQAGLGGLFAIGGTLTTATGGEFMFGFTGGLSDIRELVITTDVAAVPEPASLVLLGTGLAAAVAIRRRRRQ